MLGALRYNLAHPHFDQTSVSTYNDQQRSLVVEGVVVGEPDVRDAYTNLRVEADKLITTDQPTRTVKGPVLVQPPPFTDFRYGDRVRAEGKLQTPANTGDFDYREYLARQDVYSIMSRPRVTTLACDQGFVPLGWLYAFKARAKSVIAQILPEPQASLLTGILLGDDSGIPKSVQDTFRTTGTSHVIAISGYNVMIPVWLASQSSVIGHQRTVTTRWKDNRRSVSASDQRLHGLTSAFSACTGSPRLGAPGRCRHSPPNPQSCARS